MSKLSISEVLSMPAEWEKQSSTWIAWPHNKDDWPKKFDLIPEVFAKIVFYISKVQKVNILVQNVKNLIKLRYYIKHTDQNLLVKNVLIKSL